MTMLASERDGGNAACVHKSGAHPTPALEWCRLSPVITRALPTGTVTFLFTDVQSSSRLWERYPETMPSAVARHDTHIEQLVEAHRGHVVHRAGEAEKRFAVFARATDAVAAAAAIQQALYAEVWPGEVPLRVRLAVHTGQADLRD